MGLIKRLLSERPETSQTTVKQSQDHVEIKHLTAADFDDSGLKCEQAAIVDFWAEWCGPCHMIAPSVQGIADEYAGRVMVAKLNADEHPEVLGRYGVMGIPTLIYFKGGKEVDRVVGVTGYAALKNKTERLLA